MHVSTLIWSQPCQQKEGLVLKITCISLPGGILRDFEVVEDRFLIYEKTIEKDGSTKVKTVYAKTLSSDQFKHITLLLDDVRIAYPTDTLLEVIEPVLDGDWWDVWVCSPFNFHFHVEHAYEKHCAALINYLNDLLPQRAPKILKMNG